MRVGFSKVYNIKGHLISKSGYWPAPEKSDLGLKHSIQYLCVAGQYPLFSTPLGRRCEFAYLLYPLIEFSDKRTSSSSKYMGKIEFKWTSAYNLSYALIVIVRDSELLVGKPASMVNKEEI